MWKILIEEVKEVIYDSLGYRGLFPEKRDAKVDEKGTGDLEYIYQHII